jgi:hypothetical protein
MSTWKIVFTLGPDVDGSKRRLKEKFDPVETTLESAAVTNIVAVGTRGWRRHRFNGFSQAIMPNMAIAFRQAPPPSGQIIAAAYLQHRGLSLPSFDLVTGLHLPGKVSSERKKNIALCLVPADPAHNIGRLKMTIRPKAPQEAQTAVPRLHVVDASIGPNAHCANRKLRQPARRCKSCRP